MTTPWGASAGLAFVIRQWPSSTAPFAMTMTGASTSPVTRALASSTTCSLAVTSPTTSPRTTRVAVRTVARTTACSPMTRVSLDVISPENFASSITVPAHVYFPSISEPSSRKAPMRPGALPVRLPHMIQPSVPSEPGSAGSPPAASAGPRFPCASAREALSHWHRSEPGALHAGRRAHQLPGGVVGGPTPIRSQYAGRGHRREQEPRGSPCQRHVLLHGFLLGFLML